MPDLEAPFWGFMGAAFALIFSNMGAAYGTGKSGIGISTLGVNQPELIMKSIVPVRPRSLSQTLCCAWQKFLTPPPPAEPSSPRFPGAQVVMAGVLGIYGLIIAVIIANEVTTVVEHKPSYTSFKAFAHFGGGIACGLSGLAAGLAIGIVGESLTQASAAQPKLFVGMVLILIFAEALGLYGLIVGLILSAKAAA